LIGPKTIHCIAFFNQRQIFYPFGPQVILLNNESSSSKPESHPADVQRGRDPDDSDQVILAALEDIPLASLRQLS
jgi:hypothetical protein